MTTKKTKPADQEVERKRAESWAADKAIPRWLMAAARVVAVLSDGTDFDSTSMTEADFDVAINRVR